MKTIVFVHDLVEVEIKPNESLAEFHALTARDVTSRLAAAPLKSINCPGCQSSESDFAFEKCGLMYRQCRACASLYVSPRPDEAALVNYYRNAPAAKFWREKILATTETVRLEKVIQPRVDWVMDGITEYAPLMKRGVDLSSYGRLFAKALSDRSGGSIQLTAAHPLADLDFALPVNGVAVLPKPLIDVPSFRPADFITAFDAIDRCADVPVFVNVAYHTLRVDGLLFLTAPTISGFDLQVLWDRSPAIMPPDKINLLSIEGLTNLFPKPRWEICEISTPGAFDVEAVHYAIQSDPNGDWPRFIRYLMTHRAGGSLIALQEFLQANRLSSFARLLIRKVAQC